MLKPLETKKEKEKKERNKRFVVSILIALIMILSVIGFTIEFAKRQEESKGESGFYEYKVVLRNQAIIVRTLFLKNETQIRTNFIPYIDYFGGKKFYYYSDPSVRESSLRLLTYISYFSYLNEACVDESVGNYSCYNEELPIKNCKDNLLIFELSNETSIEKKENCIFIRGSSESLVEIDRAIDNFLYNLFGIE
ncbi:MAG: hypothetical protein QW622_02115 [Candidatus Pacearchaeota archaeon]